MVRLLAVSDVHTSLVGLETTHKLIMVHKPDIVVVCGDITHFGPAKWAKKYLTSIQLPVLAVNGNCDTREVVEGILANEEWSLIDRSMDLLGLRFVGLGYPPGRRLDAIEMQSIDVLVTHMPPKGYNDQVWPGSSIGDTFVRELVLKTSPRLVLSGHVHEARGICKLSESLCVNPGPVKDTFGAVIEIGENVQARLIEAGP